MFTPTPSSPGVVDPDAVDGWSVVEAEMFTGPNGSAAVLWMAASAPLRMQWRVGARAFKRVEEARDYAKRIVGVAEA